MCGICGIASAHSNAQSKRLAVEKMTDAMLHRGPDSCGFWETDGIALGHRRLSIIDLSESGNQPLISYDGRFIICYNGELYNYRELRFELQRAIQGGNEKPYPFKTQTDTEVVLAACMRWGEKAIERLNGMFAFAIYDRQEKSLRIVRDRLGVKPLYYHFDQGRLVFASEIKALLRSGLIPSKISGDALQDYLRYQTVHAPQTLVENVQMLLPGHILKFTENKIEIRPYWKLEDQIEPLRQKGLTYKEICGNIKTLFLESVERRLVADVPFGAFLSGGIDSTAVVGAMSRISGRQVDTFSVVFDEGQFSEKGYAKQVSELYGTRHHEILVRPTDFLEKIATALIAVDHPGGDGLNTFVVAQATKNAGITMALSGIGSDELFCGYPVFTRNFRLERNGWVNIMPRVFRKPISYLLPRLHPSVASEKLSEFLIQSKLNFNSSYPIARRTLSDRRIKKLLAIGTLDQNKVSLILDRMGVFSSRHRLSKYSVAEMSTYLPNVLLRDTDQMSMAVSLEVREPFLDHHLVKYVLSVEDCHKYPHYPKKLLVDSLGDLIPDNIAKRKKMGFVLPWDFWMRNELRAFCSENLKSLPAIGFNGNAVDEIWGAFQKGRQDIPWSSLWHLVSLGNWLRNI